MQKVNLNLIPGGVRPVINVSQYDEGRQFQLAIFNGSASYDLTGKTVVIEVGKLDGNGVAYDDTDEVNNIPVVAISANIVTITTPKQMTAVAGQNNAELKISDSSAVVGTLNFILDCEQSALSPDTPILDTQIPALEDLASQNAQKALDAVAHYPYIDPTTKDWFVWDVDTGAFVDTGVRAEGIDGQGSVQTVNSVLPDANGNVSLPLNGGFTDILPTGNGGTGNADGYIRTGIKTGSSFGVGSTVEGANNESFNNSQYTNVEGANNKSCHNYQHINGIGNELYSYATTGVGQYGNDYAIDSILGSSLFVVGNGTSKANPANAFVVGANGNVSVQGKLFKGNTINGVNLSDGYPSAGNNLSSVERTRTIRNGAHAAGSYVYIVEDDQLYQVGSTALAINDTLTPGTNATAVKVTDILGQLNSDLTPKTVSTLSPTSNISSSSTLRCYTLGKLCTIQMSMNVNSSLAANAKLFTGAPVPYANNTAYATLNGIGKSLPIAMNANGECYVDGTAGSNSGWMDGCFVYIMA